MAPPTTETAHRPTRQAPPLRWWQRPWIIPLALFSLTFLAFSIPPYTTFDPDTARFPIREDIAWHYPMMLSHIFGGALLTCLVVFQVWPWLRANHPRVHRWSGRTYVLFGVPFVGIPALMIAPLSHSGMSTAISNTVWAVLWLTFTLIGYRMARQRRFARHREWMLRSFVLVYAIALNRVIVFALILGLWPFLDVQEGVDMAEVGLAIAPASSFLSWILPLLFVEWWLQYRKPRRRTRHARATRENGATSSTPAPSHTV